jgi:hypothetical protein
MQGSVEQNQHNSIQKLNEAETKASHYQMDVKENQINLNEFIGKRMAANGELRNFSNPAGGNTSQQF